MADLTKLENDKVGNTMTNIDKFMEVYAKVLPEVRKEHPDLYTWPEEQTPQVLEKMKVAFEKGTFNHDGLAMRKTCKALGIKHTRTSMLTFFKETA